MSVDLAVRYGARRILTLVNELSPENHTSQFGSVIFTLESNDDIKRLGNLKNQRVAAVHPTSLGGWIMAQRELQTHDIDRWSFASLRFLNTHDAVVNAIQSREAEVGIVRTDTLERMNHEGLIEKENFRILAAKQYDQFPFSISTPLYPEWPFAMLSHTPLELARKVSITLLSLPSEHSATKDAHIYGWTIPENYETVDDLLRLLALPPYNKKTHEKLISILARYWYWYLLFSVILLSTTILSMRVIRLKRSLTEHKTTLEISREAQVATFEQAAVGLAHIIPTGKFLRTNQKLCDIISLTRQQLKEINLKDLLYSDDLPTCIKAIDQLRQNKLASTSLQLRINCADGHSKWIQLSLSTKPDIKGQVEYLVAVIDDIDKYKKLEEENHRTQQQKELILDIAGDGIIGLDDQARHTFVNPAAANLLGYSIEEMIGKESHLLWHHSYEDGSPLPTAQCPITEVLKTGEIQRGDKEIVWNKSGDPVEVEYISTPIKESDKITGAVIILHPLSSDQPDPPSPQSAS
ncbi:MAG: PAS domain S-box protein [Candidatus Thiodiazotropha sp. 6PDIVS]